MDWRRSARLSLESVTIATDDSRIVEELFHGRRGPLASYMFELATAFGWLLAGVTSLLDPTTLIHSTVGHNVVPFAAIWSGLYIGGGVGVIAGVLRPLPALRVAGLLLLGTGLIMQTVAAISFQFTPRAIGPAVYASAAFARAWVLVVLIRRVSDAAA